LAFVLGLAASYHPLVLLTAVFAAAPWASRVPRERATMLHAGASFALGLAPLLFGLALTARAPELLVPEPLLAALPSAASALAFATREIGVLLLAASVAGAVLVALRGESRKPLAAAALVIAAGALSLRDGGAPLAAPVLAALVAVHALAAVALAAAVVAI